MATTGILRSRRSAAQLHAIASVEREIRAIDPATGRKYLRDFREAYCSYEKVIAPATSATKSPKPESFWWATTMPCPIRSAT